MTRFFRLVIDFNEEYRDWAPARKSYHLSRHGISNRIIVGMKLSLKSAYRHVGMARFLVTEKPVSQDLEQITCAESETDYTRGERAYRCLSPPWCFFSCLLQFSGQPGDAQPQPGAKRFLLVGGNTVARQDWQ